MGQAQVGTLIGGSQISDENLNSEAGTSGLSDAVFAATKDISSARAAIGTINASFANGIYTDSYLDSLGLNDLVYIIRENADIITSAESVGTWVKSTDYDLGARIALSTGTVQATTAGKSGSGTEPSLPGSVGESVSDGTVVWNRLT